mmetsp:Transcript_146828/g.471430  ORF Transcript_146828/g.471430 Transcript_146828/m.471430 type:complete len:82 (-) Transcript_146828:28-273(-)
MRRRSSCRCVLDALQRPMLVERCMRVGPRQHSRTPEQFSAMLRYMSFVPSNRVAALTELHRLGQTAREYACLDIAIDVFFF